ncbi:MAG: amidohydrolase family protein, partial [Candidatus Binatia bacterium]
MEKPVVVDADGHVVEPPELLSEYIDPAFRDRIPEYVREGNREYLVPRDPTISETPGWFPQEKMFVVCAPNNAGRPWSEAGRPFREGLAGAWDPHARIRDMDAEGIDVAVLYPTYALGHIEDAELQGAAFRAYNRWLRDYCSAYPKRLYGVAAVALGDPAGAARELGRCVKEYDFRGAFIRPNPYVAGKKLNDPAYDPFWRACEDLDVAIGLHPYLMADMQGAVRGLGLEAREDIFFKQALGNPVDMMAALVAFTAGGV